MKIKHISLKEIKKFLKKIPRVIAENAFLSLLAVLLLAFLLGGFIFYKYSILTKRVKPEVSEKSFQFDKDSYRYILRTWQEREKRFQEADSKEYTNPFQPR